MYLKKNIYPITLSSSISWLVTTPYLGISAPRNNVSSVTSLFAPIICPIRSDFPWDCCDAEDLLFITWEDSWFVWFPTFFIEDASLFNPCPDVVDDLLTPDSLLCSRFSSAGDFPMWHKRDIRKEVKWLSKTHLLSSSIYIVTTYKDRKYIRTRT